MKKSWLIVIFMSWSISPLLAQSTFQKKVYYDDELTKLKELITLSTSDSLLHGYYQSVFENGSLAIEGFYDQGVSDSLWTYFFENGRIKAKGRYLDGLKSGKWLYQYESGTKRAEGEYLKNIQHGDWSYFFENGEPKSSGNYSMGLKNGIWNYFYEDESLKAQAYFEQGKGTYKEFYPNGKLKHEGTNALDKSEGKWTYYFESGSVEAVGYFAGGLREGKWNYFHENGQKSAEGNFSKGAKTGIWTYYFPDGSISSAGEMTENQKQGFWKLYYQTGEIKGEGKYDNGTGEYIEYYASGKQKARGQVLEGEKSGTWQYYNEQGLIDGIAEFENGLGQYVGKYPDGTLKMTGQLEDDRRVGKWTLYNPNGDIAGTYMPVYEEQQPIFRTTTLASDKSKRKLPSKPEYRYRNKQLRYFDPTINEYTGWILSTNPVATLFDQLPLALEYYKQERLGHELQLTYLKSPFFEKSELVNHVSSLGFNVDLKQKFYHQDTKLGMFYFGHQVRGGYSRHSSMVLDSVSTTSLEEKNIGFNETRIGYGIIIGDRWMQRAGDSGLTFDFNIGIMIGQRNINKSFDPRFDSVFDELNQEKFYLPLLFTLHIGYAGPKRRSTSF
ncbi:MAG: membrane-binding protein [Cyclobacteriaceae bacterium]